MSNSFLKKGCPYLYTHSKYSQAKCSPYRLDTVNCLLAWMGETFVRKTKPSVQPALPGDGTFMDPLAPIFHIIVCSFMLYLYQQTQAVLYLVSVRAFIHFVGISLGVFFSHFLFQLLKFLSPASWGFGCRQKGIRILRGWGETAAPEHCSLPFSVGDSGPVGVLPFPRG